MDTNTVLDTTSYDDAVREALRCNARRGKPSVNTITMLFGPDVDPGRLDSIIADIEFASAFTGCVSLTHIIEETGECEVTVTGDPENMARYLTLVNYLNNLYTDPRDAS